MTSKAKCTTNVWFFKSQFWKSNTNVWWQKACVSEEFPFNVFLETEIFRLDIQHVVNIRIYFCYDKCNRQHSINFMANTNYFYQGGRSGFRLEDLLGNNNKYKGSVSSISGELLPCISILHIFFISDKPMWGWLAAREDTVITYYHYLTAALLSINNYLILSLELEYIKPLCN